MADQAAILVNKKVVKLNGLSNLRYLYKEGYLYGFTVEATGVKYIHLVEKDARKSTLEMFQQSIPAGYYSENAFFQYNKDNDIKALLDTKYDGNFVQAQINDLINVKKIQLFSPYIEPSFEFGNYITYTITYNNQMLFDNLGNIIVPSTPAPVVTSMNLGDLAKNFYSNNIHHINLGIDDVVKNKIAMSIASIAIYIDNIRSFIYPLFGNDVPEFLNLKNNQDAFWGTSIFGNITTYAEIVKYEEAIYNFFRKGYLNKIKIQEAKGYEKLYWLTLGMSVNSLSVLTSLNKISLLSWMQKNVRLGQSWFVLNDNEGLVIKIINSVTEDQADLFLEQLFLYSEINRDNLFERLTDEKGFLSDNNIDDSTFGIGEDNRYNFIMGLYAVWQISSYNPYQNDVYSETNLDHFTYNNELGCNPDIANNIFVDVFDLNPLKLNFDAKPISFNYQSTSSGGYFIDNFYFRSTNIKGDTSVSHWDNLGTDIRDFNNLNEAPQNKVLAFQKEYRKDGKDGLYGTYDYLQSVSLIDVNQSAAIKIAVVNGTGGTNSDVNNLIPIFVLKYIDDRNLSSNIETTVSYLIDVASLWFGGTALISKFRYIRKISPFTNAIIGGEVTGSQIAIRLYFTVATEAVNFTAASLSLYCKIITNPSNANAPWLISLKETLMWVEIFSGVGSMAAENMLKKKTKKLVDDFNANNNWPTEFTDDARGVEAQMTLQKISGVATDITNYTSDALVRLEKKFNLDYANFERNLYSLAEQQQIIAIGYNKGLTADEISGIIHQACRKRPVTMAQPISVLETRMVNFLERKRLRCPFTHPTRVEFEDYHDNWVQPTFDMFGLPNYNKTFGGSSVTSPTSFSPGIQDTDWTTYWRNEEEVNLFLERQKELYKEWGKLLGKDSQWAGKKIREMRNWYNKTGLMPKNAIIAIDNNNVTNLAAHLKSFPDQFKTDITPKLFGINNTSPAIKY